MNKRQDDIIKMFDATCKVCETNNAVWNTNIPFTNAVQKLSDNLKAISEKRVIQESDYTGITQDKKNSRTALEELACKCAGILFFYATQANNNDLRVSMNLRKSNFTKARDNGLVGISEQVHDAAQKHAAAVLPFGLTGAMITALGDDIKEYVHFINRPAEADRVVEEASGEIAALITSTSALLKNQIDMGMALYRTSHEKFYAQYQIARTIVSSVRQKRALQITCTNDQTGKALPGVSVVVNHTVRKKSGKKGIIYVQNHKEGHGLLTATLTGYVSLSMHFNVVAGQTTKLFLGMKKA